MAVTPGTLVRHELAGLDAEVVSASNPEFVGIAGTVVAETTKTLGIERNASGEKTARTDGVSRVSQVPKAAATFAFDLPDGTTVTVAGERLVARPARRTEQTGDSQWR